MAIDLGRRLSPKLAAWLEYINHCGDATAIKIGGSPMG